MHISDGDEGTGLVGRWRWDWPWTAAVVLLGAIVLAFILIGYL